MRVVKTLLWSIVSILLVLGLIFALMREVLLITATSRVKNSLQQVRQIDSEQTYLTECMSRGSSKNEAGRIHHTQLRFIDRSHYVVEVVCNRMEHDPLEVDQNKLPTIVKLESGQSGIRWPADAGMNFHCLRRTASVSVADNMIHTSLRRSEINDYQGPPSNCPSYGFQCCDETTQIGQGEQIFEALDCPQTCFRDCLDRPLILSFSSQPHYNRLTRTLEIEQSEPVSFSYLVTPNQEADLAFTSYEASLQEDWVEQAIALIDTILYQSPEVQETKVILDFGDGSVDEFIGLRGQVEHKYECAGNECLYHATLTVINADGVESLQTAQNTIKVLVQ